MLWLEPLPWGRWLLVGLIAAAALYLEFRPDPTVELLFATRDIQPGETVDETNTETRPVPTGLFEGAGHGDVAGRPVSIGDPVLASGISATDQMVPTGWWVVAVTLPDGARAGDAVRLVLLDVGKEVEGVVAHPGSDDPFAAADGGVAVPAESSAEVALATANGRLAVLISTG